MGRSIGRRLGLFVQRFMRATEPLELWKGPLAALGKFGTSRSASRRELVSMSYREQAIFLGEMVMVEPGSPLLAFSDHVAELVERTAGTIVAVHGGGRWPASGIQ